MKRILVVLTAVFAALAFGSVAAVGAPPAPASPIVWTGNGTTGGLCNQVFESTDVAPGDQVWLFILTGPSSDNWALNATFDDGTNVTNVPPSKVVGSIHFEVTTDVGAKLLSASATNGSTNSVLTVSHCTANGETPPPPEGTGSIAVVKTVVPLTLGVTGITLPTSYTAHVHCSDGDTTIDEDVTLPGTGGAGDPAFIDGIPFGSTCTVVEDATGFPNQTDVKYAVDGVDSTGVVNVAGITIDKSQADVEVEIQNDFSQVQGETVVKPTETPAAQAVAVAPAFTG
ncbi:MAG: DUF5979 domain-containing protein [Acidimicrobiia bacterium]